MGTSDKSDRILKNLATTLANCSKEATLYAACVENALPNVRLSFNLQFVAAQNETNLAVCACRFNAGAVPSLLMH